MRILPRYIVAEMMGPFIVGVVGFVMVMVVDLLFTMADLIINKGVPLFIVLKLMFYKLPAILVMTFPVSTLFATAMALGRLSMDSELVALRTSGVSLMQIAKPILLVGLIVSLITFATNEKIVPPANYVATKLIRQIIYKQPLPEVKENVFFKDAHNRYYYARRVDLKTKTLQGLMVFEVSGDKFPRVITADQASINERLWLLKQGVVHKYDDLGLLNYEAKFSEMQLNVADDVMQFSQQKDTQEMDTKELGSLIKAVGQGGAQTSQLRTDWLMKYSVPLTCFVFALIGIPFSLPQPRSGRTWGMVVTIVSIFTFYVIASIFRSLGRGGIIDPFWAAFTPQISFVVLGLLLLYRQNKV